MKSKEQKLIERLKEFPRLFVAYSGGVDSAYLMHVASLALGEKVVGVLADSPSLPRQEKEEALALAKARSWNVTVIHTSEMNHAEYVSNPANRCYYCKQELFQQMEKFAREAGGGAMAYGENADDMSDVRHGRQAADEFSIVAPLREVGLTKAEIREFSKLAGLPTASKPAQPCLSSRIPNGRPVTLEALSQIEKGEGILKESGFQIFRLRHFGEEARIQVAPDEHSRLMDFSIQKNISDKLTPLGFQKITFDLEPYRGASLK